MTIADLVLFLAGGWLGGSVAAFTNYDFRNWQWWVICVPTCTLYVAYKHVS